MEHSVIAYIRRLPKEKAEIVLKQWSNEKERPFYVTHELMEELRRREREGGDDSVDYPCK